MVFSMESESSLTVVKINELECPKLDDGIWWDFLTKWRSLDNLYILEFASRFKCKMSPIDLEVAFKDLCKGTTILALEGVFHIEWSNKAWKNTCHTRKDIESTNIVSKRVIKLPRMYVQALKHVRVCYFFSMYVMQCLVKVGIKLKSLNFHSVATRVCVIDVFDV